MGYPYGYIRQPSHDLVINGTVVGMWHHYPDGYHLIKNSNYDTVMSEMRKLLKLRELIRGNCCGIEFK